MIIGNGKVVMINGATYIREACFGELENKLYEKWKMINKESLDDLVSEFLIGLKEEMLSEIKEKL